MDIIPLYHSSQYGYGCLCEDCRGSREQMHLSEGHGENQHQKLGGRGSCSSAHRLQSGQDSIKLHGFWRYQWTAVTSAVQHLFTAWPELSRRLNAYAICAVQQDRQTRHARGTRFEILITQSSANY